MTTTTDFGKPTFLTGKSGYAYYGTIYEDKNCVSNLSGPVIVCLSNSYYDNGHWHHTIRDIYDTSNIDQILTHFRERDDISHLVLIPSTTGFSNDWDRIDDLRRSYIH